MMKRFYLSCAAVLTLCGCKGIEATGDALAGPPLASFVVVDAVSVINTQKTVDDHLVSLFTGKDCSTIRASKGGHYCVDQPQPGPTVVQTTYCYKSLANVTCYDTPLASDTARLYGVRVDDIPLQSQAQSR